MSYYPTTPEQAQRVKTVAKIAFPSYKGRKIRLVVDRIPSQVDSYWDGGSRNYFTFVHLVTGETIGVHTNHPVFEAGQPRKLDELPVEVALVEHSIFCGKDAGVTVYARPEALGIGIDAGKQGQLA